MCIHTVMCVCKSRVPMLYNSEYTVSDTGESSGHRRFYFLLITVTVFAAAAVT